MTKQHVDRMILEADQLKTRVDSLNAFIHSNPVFKTLDDLEQARMIKQCGFMESYFSTLSSRIWVAKTN